MSGKTRRRGIASRRSVSTSPTATPTISASDDLERAREALEAALRAQEAAALELSRARALDQTIEGLSAVVGEARALAKATARQAGQAAMEAEQAAASLRRAQRETPATGDPGDLDGLAALRASLVPGAPCPLCQATVRAQRGAPDVARVAELRGRAASMQAAAAEAKQAQREAIARTEAACAERAALLEGRTPTQVERGLALNVEVARSGVARAEKAHAEG